MSLSVGNEKERKQIKTVMESVKCIYAYHIICAFAAHTSEIPFQAQWFINQSGKFAQIHEKRNETNWNEPKARKKEK